LNLDEQGANKTRMNILLIDDHRLFAYGLKLALQQLNQNINVDEAYTAQRALGLIDADQKYDLILTDLQMPGFSGHELLVLVVMSYYSLLRLERFKCQ